MYADTLAIESGSARSEAARDAAKQVTGEIVPLLTNSGSLEEKLRQVAKHLWVRNRYEAVDFMVLEGSELEFVRHHQFVGALEGIAGAWETSVQVRASLSAFAEMSQNLAPVIYGHMPSDPRLSDMERGFASKAGFLSILLVPLIWDGRLRGALAVASKLKEAFGSPEAEFLTTVAGSVSALLRQQLMIEDLSEANERILGLQDDTVTMLACTAEAHDPATADHLRGVRCVTEMLADELGLCSKDRRILGQASVLHDIGKVRVQRRLLMKPAALTTRERAFIENHTVWGAALLSGHPGFELAAKVARWHHERWDGAGYPDGLRQGQIPRDVTIVTVADVYDAIVRCRPYSAGHEPGEAVAEILRCSGGQFNPDVARALGRLHDRGVLPRPAPSSSVSSARGCSDPQDGALGRVAATLAIAKIGP